MLYRFLKKWSPYWHVLTALTLAIYLCIGKFNEVSAYGPRITQLEKNQEVLQEVRFNLRSIASKLGVDYISERTE